MSLFVKAVGYSAVTEPRVVSDYDFDRDEITHMICGRIVKKPGVNVKLQKVMQSHVILTTRKKTSDGSSVSVTVNAPIYKTFKETEQS